MEVANQHLGAEERATRCVSWFIAGNYDGGEATCRRWEGMVAEAVALMDAENEDATAEEVAYELAEALKDWLEEERGDVAATPFDDMLGYMLACVDWQQLALDAVEEEIRQQS